MCLNLNLERWVGYSELAEEVGWQPGQVHLLARGMWATWWQLCGVMRSA